MLEEGQFTKLARLILTSNRDSYIFEAMDAVKTGIEI